MKCCYNNMQLQMFVEVADFLQIRAKPGSCPIGRMQEKGGRLTCIIADCSCVVVCQCSFAGVPNPVEGSSGTLVAGHRCSGVSSQNTGACTFKMILEYLKA